MNRSFRSKLVTIMMVSGVAACEQPDTGEYMIVRDSADVRIIELDWDAAPPGPQVALDPEWVVGDEAAGRLNFPLFNVRDVEAVNDGLILIAQGSTQEILRVDLEGGQATRLGGAGDGPAEFRRLTSVWAEGEEAVGALDAQRNRIVVLEQDGSVLREESLAAWRTQQTSPSLVRSGDGTRYLLQVGGVPGEWVEGWSRTTAPVIRLDPAPDTLAVLPGSEVVMVTDVQAFGIAFGVLPFGATAVAAAAEGGIWLGDTRDGEVTFWESREGPEVVLRWVSDIDGPRMNRRARTQAHLDGMDPEDRALFEHMYEPVPDSEPLPAFHALHTGEDGRLWIGRRGPADVLAPEVAEVSYEWLVFDLTTLEVNRVTTPQGFRPMRIPAGSMLGVHTDLMGIETVRSYRLGGN